MPVSVRLPLVRCLIAAAVGATLSTALVGCIDLGESEESSVALYGSAFAAPVSGASCAIKNSSGTTVAGPTTTNGSGNYGLHLETQYLSSDLVVECSGGTYVDEATGATVNASGALSVYVPANSLSNGSQVHATAATTVVAAMVRDHGKSLSEAQNAFQNAFGFGADYSVAPADATAPAAGASTEALQAGLRAATFSQLAADLGLSEAQQYDLLSALAEDLADGQLDGAGMAGDVAVAATGTMLGADIRNRFGAAMLNFRAGGRDQSGLANDAIGALPFATTAVTASYRIEYLPGTMAAMQGKSQFQIRVTDVATGTTPQSGLALSLMPMMYMASHNHSTPVDGCSESTTAGTYDCTVYYLMASQMMDGTSMGYWALKVMVGGMMGESATFYPPVKMAMGDSVRAVLKGVSDQIAGMAMDGGMAMPEPRGYYLFKSALSGMTGNHTFQLFLAAKESMMSFPAVTSSSVLNSGDATYQLTVSSAVVEVSSDAASWIAASEDGNGYWTASGISGLTDGTQGSLYVRLTVNGEQKTTDGTAASGDNGYATFLVTPGGGMGMM